MTYKAFNDEFKETTIDSNYLRYLYVTDYEDFVKKFEDDYILDGICKDGIYKYDNDEEIWRELTSKNSLVYGIILEKVSGKVNNKKKGWNIIVILDTGERIQTNVEPVSMEDVQEAMGVLVKPSILGMRIKSFEIVAE